MSTSSQDARHLIISGHVQGVGFRYALVREARRLGVAGWVRNRRDGSVEANLSGAAPAVAALMAWSRQGPPGARVDHVAVELGVMQDGAFEQRADGDA